MAVEISNFLLAWAKVTEDGAGGYVWRGDGITSIQRTGAGEFSVFLGPRTIDPSRTVWEATSEEAANGDGCYCVLSYQTINQLDLNVYQDDGAAPPALTDPQGFSLRVTVMNVEAVPVAVA